MHQYSIQNTKILRYWYTYAVLQGDVDAGVIHDFSHDLRVPARRSPHQRRAPPLRQYGSGCEKEVRWDVYMAEDEKLSTHMPEHDNDNASK